MPFRVKFAIGFLLLSIQCFAQRNETDSLESLVRSVSPDTTKVWLLNNLVTSLREKDNNKALRFAQQAKQLAELLSYKKGLAQALENLGWILFRQGDYSKSFQLSTQALRISEDLQDKSAIARCLINIAAINYEQKQYTLAIENFKKAYQVAKMVDDHRTMARSLNNIAFTFLRSARQLDSAYAYARESFAVSKRIGDPYMIGFSTHTLGDIDLESGNAKLALKNFNDCLIIAEQHHINFLKVSSLYRLGRAYKILKQPGKTVAHLHENIDIAKKYGFKDELERSYKLLSETYFDQGDLNKAYEYQSMYLAVHDSLYDQRNSEQMALMQASFESELKETQIELLTKDAALKANEIKSQKVWLYFYTGSLSLLIILAFVLFYNNQNNNKAKRELETKNNEIEKQTQQLRNLNASKDKLFSIISHDLRSPVASLRGLMEIVDTRSLTQKEFIEITGKLKRNIDTVYEDLDNLLLWAQTQLRGLQSTPEVVDLKMLVNEKLMLFKEAARAKNVTMINDVPDDTFVLADKNHTGLVLRNLLANAIKFNQESGSIAVSCKESGRYHEISVADSGVGISLEDLDKLFNAETHFTKPGTNKEKGTGIGLLLTKEFVEANHGRIWVASELGKGATFTFTLRAQKVAVFA